MTDALFFCVICTDPSLHEGENLVKFAESVGEQVKNVAIAAGGALLAIAVVAALGYRRARTPFLPALPSPPPRRQRNTAPDRQARRSLMQSWTDKYKEWRRKYEGWTDVRRAIYTATRPEGRAGVGYLVGALASRLGVFVGKMSLPSLLTLIASRMVRPWARRADSRAAFRKRRQLVRARERSRSRALIARKAQSESAANVIVYCMGLEQELKKVASNQATPREP